MKNIKINSFLASILGFILISLPLSAGASTPTVSCTGTPGATSITWTSSITGGVTPLSILWGNSSTSTSQTVTVTPGTYSMSLQVTDASSTVATTTCSATVLQQLPSITSFTATPSIITAGQSTVLAWTVGNASSTTINNGVGLVSGSSITVQPTYSTTYQLTAVNPVGTTTSNVLVTVNATSTNSSIQALIQSLLTQIANLKAQLIQLIQQQSGGNGTGTTTNPGTPGTPSDSACFNFNRDLSRGHRGEDVKALQRFLANNNLLSTSTQTTGFFGKDTEKALRKYQEKYGIASTSSSAPVFGPKSQKFFKEHCMGNNEKDNENENDD